MPNSNKMADKVTRSREGGGREAVPLGKREQKYKTRWQRQQKKNTKQANKKLHINYV